MEILSEGFEYMSNSRLSAFEQCPAKFKKSYIDQDPRKNEKTESLSFGSAVHAALENLGRYHLKLNEAAEEYGASRAQPDTSRDFALRLWDDAVEGFGLSNGLYDEGAAIIERALLDSRSWGERVLAVEPSFDIMVMGHRLHGFIDRVDKIDDKTIRVVDYKTNRSPYSSDKLKSDLQLPIYWLAAKQMFPWAENVLLEFDFLRLEERTVVPSPVDEKKLRHLIGRKIHKIYESDTFPAKINPLCSYCSFRSDCGKYQNFLSKTHDEISGIKSAGLPIPAGRIEDANQLSSFIRKERERLHSGIKRQLDMSGGEVEVDGKVYSYTKRTYKSYDTHSTINMMHDAGLSDRIRDVIKIDKSRMDDLILSIRESMPEDEYDRIREMQRSCIRTSTRNYINVSEKK